ncbi:MULTISPECIES: SigE family RNA polymerase sigma factor [unclassified Nonomuraea]|uniref:SigE family RNA polymerase sigma factor n=1 Tax=unclassified Nonomuraea TaxID=2593643 RepID=UPI0035BF9639
MDDSERLQFGEFVKHRLPALFRYALVLAVDARDAEDLVQEALTRTGAAWWRVRRKDDPERYVRTIMTNIMSNRWRRGRREITVAELPERAVDDPSFARLPGMDGVDRVLALLPPRMRAVIFLRYVEQLTEREIAQALGCSQGTVKSQAARGLAKLRAALADEEERHG